MPMLNLEVSDLALWTIGHQKCLQGNSVAVAVALTELSRLHISTNPEWQSKSRVATKSRDSIVSR